MNTNNPTAHANYQSLRALLENAESKVEKLSKFVTAVAPRIAIAYLDQGPHGVVEGVHSIPDAVSEAIGMLAMLTAERNRVEVLRAVVAQADVIMAAPAGDVA